MAGVRILAALVSLLVSAAALVLPAAFPAWDVAWPDAASIAAVAVIGAIVVALVPRASADPTPLLTTCFGALSLGGSLAVVVAGDAARPFRFWVLVPAVAALAVFVAQLLRGTGAQGRIEALSSGMATVLIAASGAGWYVVQMHDAGGWSLLVAAVAAVLGAAVAFGLAARGAGVGRWVLAGAGGVLAAGTPAALTIMFLAERFGLNG